MKTRSEAFTALDDRPTRSPRYVVAVSFDADDADRLWLTSAADAALPAGTAAGDVVHGCIPRGGISGKTQVLKPETGASSIGSVSFKFQDIGGAISARVYDRLNSGASWRHQHIQVFIGHQGLAWDDYTPALTLLIDDHKIKDGVVYLRGRDPGALAKTDIFVGHQTTLAASVTDTDTTIPITSLVPGHFPVHYHPANYSYDAGQACGYVKIKDEIIKHFGVNAAGNAFEGVERGALGTLASAYTIDPADADSQKLAISEYIAFEGLAVEWHYALQVGLVPAGQNLLANHFDLTGAGWVLGGGVGLAEAVDPAPVPWGTAWLLNDDDPAVWENLYQSVAADYGPGDVITASVLVRHDSSHTDRVALRVYLSGDGGNNYFTINLDMSTGVAGAAAVGGCVVDSSDAVLIGDWWLLRISGHYTGAGAVSSLLWQFYPAYVGGGGSAVNSAEVFSPFLGAGEVYGWYPIPAHWSLGIDPRHVDIEDYYSIGGDLWLPELGLGKRVRFWNLEAEEARQFMREQLGVWLGVFQPVYGDGRLGLRRLGSVLPYSSYDAYLSDADLIGYGALQHDHGALINVIVLHWNWARATEAYNNKTFIIDSVSIGKYGEAPIKEYKFRGVYHGAHSDEDLLQYFDSIRDRFVAPPVKIQVTVPARWARLDPGDRVRLKTAHVWDSNAGANLDRSFEVQSVKIDWLRGQVTLDLFGGVERSSLVRLAQNLNIADAFLTPATGTNIATLPGAVFAGNVLTSDHALTGHATDATQAIYYYDGDLEISGTLTLSDNVALYCTGDLTISGLIDGVGGGAAGGAGNAVNNDQVLLGQVGGYGKPHSAGGLNIRFGFPGLLSSRRDRLDSTYQLTSGWRFVRAELTPPALINHNGSSLIGLARLNLKGSGGPGGQSSYFTDPTNGNFNHVAAGGDGGAGGAGLLIVARGLSFSGGLGSIDLSGADGQQGAALNYANIDPINPIAWGGSGAGGAAGACLVILDGTFTAPNRSRIIQNDGATPVPAGVGALIYREGSQLMSHHAGQVEARPWYSHRTGSPGAAQPDRLHIMPMPPPNDGGAWLEIQAEAQAARLAAQSPIAQYGGEILNVNQQWVDVNGADGTSFSNALNDVHAVADGATVNRVFRAASSSPPGSPVAGDFWLQTDTGQVLTREVGGWQPAATQNLLTRAASAPSSPQVGDQWHNTTSGAVASWDGSSWQPVATQNLLTRAASAPSSPQPGDQWHNTTSGAVASWDGTNWQPVATQNLLTRAASAPSSPQVGDQWHNTTSGAVASWDGSSWQPVATQNLLTRAASAPSSPQVGDQWHNTTSGAVAAWDGSSWQPVATHNQVTHAASPPASPVVGDMWHDTTTGVYAAWDGGAWDPVATEGAQSGVNLTDQAGTTVLVDADILNSAVQLTVSESYTVGSGGDYATLNEAVEAVSAKYPLFVASSSVKVTLQLLTGYVITEQLIVDGIDLSWIEITYQSSVARTVSISSPWSYVQTVDGSSYKPVFAALNGALFPVVKFVLDGSGIAESPGQTVMFLCDGSSRMTIAGVSTSFPAGCIGNGVAQVGAAVPFGAFALNGGIINLVRADISQCQYNVYSARGGSIIMYQADIFDPEANRETIYCLHGASVFGLLCTVDGNGTSIQGSIASYQGSRVSLTQCTFEAGLHLKALSGGEIVLENSTTIGTTSQRATVGGGGIIKITGESMTLNQAANAVTANGIIFQ